MTTSFSFSVPGRPRTWQRPTDDRRSGRRNVTDAKQRRAKQEIGMRALAARPAGWPMDATYAVTVLGVWPDRRFGDVDRLASLVMDALEGVAYAQDRQVSEVMGCRRTTRSDEAPRTDVIVEVTG